jgi:hypothetical protein
LRHATSAILAGNREIEEGTHAVLRMRYADAQDASRKSTWIDDSLQPEAAKP